MALACEPAGLGSWDGDKYIAIRTSRDDLVQRYPEAVAEPLGQSGFAAFGSAPIQVTEILRRPDFDEIQLFLVLVGEEDIYLAFAPLGEPVGYPPEHVRVRVTDWGPDVDPASVRHRVRAEGDGDVWSGVLVSQLGHSP